VNIKEYILSGIVESYVLGLANAEDAAEFERMCATHIEVRQAREEFELLLEKRSLENSVAPPRNIRSKIFSELQIESDRFQDQYGSIPVVDKENDEVKPAPVVRMNWLKWLAAASIVLLLGSTVLNFYFFNRYKHYSAQYEQILAQNTELAKNEQALRTSLQEYQNSFLHLRDTNMAVVKMAGRAVPASPDPNSAATIYWNTKTKDVYLVVNNMPAPPSDLQYQLWAIVDGKPVDAGVFDMKEGLITMKNIPRAQAFAITLEKKGGSLTPTMEKMYVLGTVQS
jgi:anti-sigma-K factor RskA